MKGGKINDNLDLRIGNRNFPAVFGALKKREKKEKITKLKVFLGSSIRIQTETIKVSNKCMIII